MTTNDNAIVTDLSSKRDRLERLILQSEQVLVACATALHDIEMKLPPGISQEPADAIFGVSCIIDDLVAKMSDVIKDF